MNGCNQETASHLSFFLCLKETNSFDLSAMYRIGVLDKKGNSLLIYKRTLITGVEFRSGLERGLRNFIHHDTLFNPSNNLIVDGKLTLICEVLKDVS